MAPKTADRTSDQTAAACQHCGLPVPDRLADHGATFCCSGCETVHRILTESGHADTYYRLRSTSARRPSLRPPSVSDDANLLAELDTDSFLDQHCSKTDGGRYQTHLFLDGVHCAACVWLIERVAAETGGVHDARLNLPKGRLTIEWHPDQLKLSLLARRLARYGYPLEPRVDGPEAPESREERRLLIRAGVSWALAGNIMLIAFALYSGLGADLAEDAALFTAARWLSLFLAVPVVFFGGSVFFRRAWASVRMAIARRSIRNLHMDTPISLGILVGFFASAWAAVTGSGEIWFDSIAILIAALLTARWLQLRSRRLAGNSSERLLALLPTMARRITPDGEPESVRADDLAPGDIIRVLGGELIPADGLVLEGKSHVDRSVLTGESLPERITERDRVFAGTTNVTSPVLVRVERSGDASRIGQLLSWVSEGQPIRSDILRVTDRIGGYFTAAVLLLAAVTAAFWLWQEPTAAAAHVIAVLVITCPCALGMAAPLSFAVGTGRAARCGAFIKNESVIERLTEIDTVILDKTGTVTTGRMTVTEISGDEDACRLAATLESQSDHPIARAVTRAFPAADDAGVEDVTTVPGAGLAGAINGMPVAVGRPDWILGQSDADETGIGLEADAADFARRGLTPVLVAADGRVIAALGISDSVRDDAPRVVRSMMDAGLDVRILSGDDADTTARVAAAVGLPVENAEGNCSPEDKQMRVQSMTADGRRILFVGDGVNDAAALQSAHVGISVAGGSAVSRMAADIYTTRPGVETVAELLEGSPQVLGRVRHLLAFSLLYNVAGGLAAFAGLVTPLVAAIAMPISSFVVVVGAIRQRAFGDPS